MGEKTTAELNNVAFNRWDCTTKQMGVVSLEEGKQVEVVHRRSIILSGLGPPSCQQEKVLSKPLT